MSSPGWSYTQTGQNVLLLIDHSATAKKNRSYLSFPYLSHSGRLTGLPPLLNCWFSPKEKKKKGKNPNKQNSNQNRKAEKRQEFTTLDNLGFYHFFLKQGSNVVGEKVGLTSGHDDYRHIFFRNQPPFQENPKPPSAIMGFSNYHDNKGLFLENASTPSN